MVQHNASCTKTSLLLLSMHEASVMGLRIVQLQMHDHHVHQDIINF